MRVAVVIPVGPRHELCVRHAVESVRAAVKPPLWDVSIRVEDDTDGSRGRSCARNDGSLAEPDADWYFWLDADDEMTKAAFTVLAYELSRAPDLEAMWGPITKRFCLFGSRGEVVDRRIERIHEDVTPIRGFDELIENGPRGAIFCGGFVKRDLHDRVGGWLEAIDLSEDCEYAWACAAHAKSFLKQEEPLFRIIGENISAEGPRGLLSQSDRSGAKLHMKRAQAICEYWRARGQVPWTARERDSRQHLYDLGAPWRGETLQPIA